MLFGGGLILEAFPWGSLQPHERHTTLVVQLYVFGHFGHLTSLVVGSALSSVGFRLGAFALPGGGFGTLALALGGFALALTLAPRGRPGTD